jgi:hypothetical protein
MQAHMLTCPITCTVYTLPALPLGAQHNRHTYCLPTLSSLQIVLYGCSLDSLLSTQKHIKPIFTLQTK